MVGTQGVWGIGRAESVGSEHRKGRGQKGWGTGVQERGPDHSCGREFGNQGGEGLKKGSGGNGGEYVGAG